MHKVKTHSVRYFPENSERGSLVCSVVLHSGKCGTQNSSINVLTWKDDKQKSFNTHWLSIVQNNKWTPLNLIFWGDIQFPVHECTSHITKC